jgi:hypothetical protein
MEQTLNQLTQSKFFTPVFNAAIFDGPVRIYFSQAQESQALKVYFHLQQQLLEAQPGVCENLRGDGRNIFVMLYPNVETFELSFDECHEDTPGVACAKLGRDYVVGVKGPVDDDESETIYRKMVSILKIHDLSFV